MEGQGSTLLKKAPIQTKRRNHVLISKDVFLVHRQQNHKSIPSQVEFLQTKQSLARGF